VYQLEVKRWLVVHRFPPREGWNVTVDIDAMERGVVGQHPPDKRAIAADCEPWLRQTGVNTVAHPLYGRADLVAEKVGHGTFVVEIEGDSSRQKEQAMYSALLSLEKLVLRQCEVEVAGGREAGQVEVNVLGRIH
jgi:hypothetical protein